ncbi:MAG: RNA polymerase sigma factor [Spirochaetia bacterium]|nr:RNA polymerase sigma factor [Spirochaetia bacterium]
MEHRQVSENAATQGVDLESPEFLEKLRSHDTAAFKQLVSVLKDRLYNLAYRLLRNREDAEEILQEAFLTIFDKIGTFQGKSKLSTWIYAIVSNAALSRIRKKGNDPVTFPDDNPLTMEKALFRNAKVVFEPQGGDALIQKELEERLTKAIDSLPTGYREMFIMKEIQKIPVKDIAAVFDLNEGAVKTRLHRARLLLRAVLSDYWEGPSHEL